MSARPHRLVPSALTLALLLTAALTVALSANAAGAVAPRTSLPAMERQVMCVTCKIPLEVAQSPQSSRERAYIQGLISQGEDEAQIKRALVAQYGPTVLALPSTHGFDLAAYLVPAAVVLGLAALLLTLLPRWRARARRQQAAPSPAPLGELDAARLESDLSRFD